MKIIINILWFILFFALMILCVQGFGLTLGWVTALVVSFVGGIVIPILTKEKNKVDEE